MWWISEGKGKGGTPSGETEEHLGSLRVLSLCAVGQAWAQGRF